MDYAFVPGFNDPGNPQANLALDVLRAVLSLRPNTLVAPNSSVFTVADFLFALDAAINIGGLDTAGDIIAGSHGTAEGQLFIGLDPTTPAPVIFESLQKVAQSQSIRIPSDVGTANTSFRLAGCLLGSDECLPVLRKLKEALGSVKNVSAPRFIHAFDTASDGASAFEYMKYAHRIVSKEPLNSRDKVVGKFGSAGLKQLDGTDVPIENWETWVPGASVLNLDPAISQELPFDLPVKIVPAVDGKTILYKNVGTWYSTVDPYDFKVHITGTIPADEAGQIALVPQALALSDQFKSSHPYPVYARYHFNSPQDFVAGLKWKPTVLPGNTLQFVGRRNRYELHVPVVKPGTPDELICNYYRVSGAQVINFTESNQPFKLFGVV